MKRIYSFFFVTMAMLMLSVSSAWAQYVKLTAEDGTESWIEIEGTINSTDIEILGVKYDLGGSFYFESAIDKSTKGSINLNEVWSRSGGRGTNYQVTSIGDYAFWGCSGLTSIVIPSSVTSIGDEAFLDCSGLTSIVIPSSVTSIGERAFEWCRDLTSLTIPNSVKSIGRLAFYGCSGLTSITIPSSVTSIGQQAFAGFRGLTSIVVESGNTKYDSRNNCNAIIEKATNTLIAGCKNTIIPSSVTTIGQNAFYECRGLTSIVIPSSVTTIGQNAFYECSGLTSVTIPSSVTTIGSSAFWGCSGLTSIVIPSSVTSIGNYAFDSCSDLTSIVVESGNTKYDSRNNCNAIIEKASNTLIVGCKNTKIPSSVTSIGYSAFRQCSGLTSVTIPSSVTSIGQSAFAWCSNLKDITSEITDVFETGSNAFYNCKNATLYVPKGLVDTYKSTADWNCISNIEEMIYKIPLTLACNSKGKVLVNGDIDFSNDVDHVDVIDGKENSFEFIPNENCRLEQVIIDGLDVMSSVKDNKLTAKIREHSKMIVTFSKKGDMNNDGNIDISDVVSLVNMILGQ